MSKKSKGSILAESTADLLASGCSVNEMPIKHSMVKSLKVQDRNDCPADQCKTTPNEGDWAPKHKRICRKA